ncbi:uncharacterized protein LOC111921865 isoform X1 [Lactuca sativa]|uniref:SnoaL-like domain-containing protein n=1 Tax=Lactuca sativa TaxID=4236 RepID=A0A9R1X8V1_LACSA|nr:uncharacterized protein LOC111921865 isoform X1 [Lactuca sativa]KAJ0199877.1 hypothetical protein LSAT_V11C600300710 [Lactuca sativa]
MATCRMPISAQSLFLPMYRQQIDKHTMQLCMKKKKKDENVRYRTHNLKKIMSSVITNSIIEQDPTPSDTITQFYKCINEKNIKQLENYISNDCFFEDYSFSNPFKGKQEVLRFLEQLITGMGQNVEFHVAHIYEDDDDLTAGVDWHLEWKNRQVPFTRGCSLYRLTREGERLMIRKAQVFVESPIKPGDLFLILLKIVTSLFDAFPEATEWFFRSQHFIVQVLLKAYCIFIVPFISPILSFYVNLGKLIVRFVSIALKILEYCSRLFTTGKR